MRRRSRRATSCASCWSCRPAKTPLPPSAPAQIFSYSVRDEQGTLHYPDSQQRPAIIPRLTLFVRRVAIGTCHLQR